MRSASSWIVRRPLAAVAAAALPIALLGLGLLRLDTDNSAEVFFPRGSATYQPYQELRRTFGPDEAVRLVISGDGVWSAAGLAWLARVERLAGGVGGVRSARGLVERHRIARWPPAEPATFRQQVIDDRLGHDLGLVGNRGETLTVWVDLEPQPRAARAATLDGLAALLDDPPEGLRAHIAGGPVLDRALDGSSSEIGRLYFPLLAVLASLLLALTFRRLAGVWVPLAFVAAVELATLGAMGWAGVRLNLVLAVLPPLLFVVALATAVHVLVRFRDFREEGMDGREAVVATYRDKGWAVLWTGVTTFAGFASLSVSPVAPVRTLGVWSGAGIALMTVLAFTLYPALLLVACGPRGEPSPPRPFERRLRRLGRRWAEAAARRRWTVLAIAAAVALLAAAGLPRLSIESNALRYLAPEHPARMDIERLESAGIGVSTVELLLTLPPAPRQPGGEERPFALGEGFATPERLLQLARLSEAARGEAAVLGALSAGDVFGQALARVTGRFPPPPDLVLSRLTTDPRGARALAALLADGAGTARVTVFVETAGLDRLASTLQALRELATAEVPGAEVAVTGKYPLLLETHRYLLQTLAISLTLTLVFVGLIFRLLLGTTRMTLLAMLPNLWPVLGVMGAMGWLGVPLDVATVMVASVVLGLAVDDTIHTLGHFREHAAERSRPEAVAATLETTAPAYVLTGCILILGFGVCAISEFAPTARFGALAAVAVALAVLGDLFLLPALLGATPEGAVRKAARRAGRAKTR